MANLTADLVGILDALDASARSSSATTGAGSSSGRCRSCIRRARRAYRRQLAVLPARVRAAVGHLPPALRRQLLRLPLPAARRRRRRAGVRSAKSLHAAHAWRRPPGAGRGAHGGGAAHAEHGRDGLRERAARRPATLGGRARRLRRHVRAPGFTVASTGIGTRSELGGHADLDGARITVPSLMATAGVGSGSAPGDGRPMRLLDDLEIHAIPMRHWTRRRSRRS